MSKPISKLQRETRRRTDPEALQAVVRAKGEGDAEREREDVVREQVKPSAEMLATKPAQYTTARASKAVGDLEGRDEGHDLRDERDDFRVVAEEVAEYLVPG